MHEGAVMIHELDEAVLAQVLGGSDIGNAAGWGNAGIAGNLDGYFYYAASLGAPIGPAAPSALAVTLDELYARLQGLLNG